MPSANVDGVLAVRRKTAHSTRHHPTAPGTLAEVPVPTGLGMPRLGMLLALDFSASGQSVKHSNLWYHGIARCRAAGRACWLLL